jgi:glucan phosphoethanolaminetransferase (alkaline phosphatase superfamily)
MALQANTSFIRSLIKNLGKAALYNIIYVSMTFVYDLICVVIVYSLFFLLLSFLPILIKIFLFVTVIVVLTANKLTFTCDWLPSLIYGKSNNRQAIAKSFSRKGKRTANIFSNYLVLTIIILGLNVAALIFTFGAGFLITLPASYLLLISFQFINYCDDNGINYFTDKNTIVKQEKEKTLSVEEFFKGEN